MNYDYSIYLSFGDLKDMKHKKCNKNYINAKASIFFINWDDETKFKWSYNSHELNVAFKEEGFEGLKILNVSHFTAEECENWNARNNMMKCLPFEGFFYEYLNKYIQDQENFGDYIFRFAGIRYDTLRSIFFSRHIEISGNSTKTKHILSPSQYKLSIFLTYWLGNSTTELLTKSFYFNKELANPKIDYGNKKLWQNNEKRYPFISNEYTDETWDQFFSDEDVKLS